MLYGTPKLELKARVVYLTLASAELSRLFNSAKRRSINYDFLNINKREALDCNE